jgi:hypothetical protein
MARAGTPIRAIAISAAVGSSRAHSGSAGRAARIDEDITVLSSPRRKIFEGAPVDGAGRRNEDTGQREEERKREKQDGKTLL